VIGKAHRIYIEDFVTVEDGTGLVHSAVMYGEEDFLAAKKSGLPQIPSLDHKGKYFDEQRIPEHLRGVFFKDADKIILKELAERGLVYKTESYTHSYPHCYRCGTALFYNALPAWFMNIQKIKPDLMKNNQSVNWYPEHLKEGRFGKSMEQAPDWNISRNRYWATALPFWKCQNKDCKNVVCVGSVKELKNQSTNFAEVYPQYKEELSSALAEFPLNSIDLHRPYIDNVILKCDKCSSEMHRIPEVVDCWVESASMPFAELHYPFENQELFKQRFPADFVAEYIAQTRAWFYVMHVISTVQFEKAPFKHVVTTGNILAEDGSKMSKSKNNYPDPWLVIEKYGIDAVRFYLLASPVMNGDDLNFSEKGVMEVGRKVNALLYNVWSFYRMYETGRSADVLISGSAKHVLDKWVLSRLAELQTSVTDNLDAYDTVRAGKSIVEFINDLSTWYVRRSRDRIKGSDDSAKAALGTLGFVLAEVSKLLAPFMPFLSDFIYKDVTGEESVHLAKWPDGKLAADNNLIAQMESAREIVSLGLAARKEKVLSVRQPLAALEFTVKAKDVSLPEGLLTIIAEELNVKAARQVEKVSKEFFSKTDPASGTSVGIDTVLTEELKHEGQARELERQVQDLRKKSGLKVGELVDLYYNTADEKLEAVLLKTFDRKKTFVSQINKSLEVEVDFEQQAEIGGQALWLGMVKI